MSGAAGGGAGGGDKPAPRRSSVDDIIDIYKRDEERTLLREQLRKTPAERVRDIVKMERFADELRQAAHRAAK